MENSKKHAVPQQQKATVGPKSAASLSKPPEPVPAEKKEGRAAWLFANLPNDIASSPPMKASK